MSGIDVYTKLCLHSDISGNPDASASNHTQTSHGSASISTLQSEFGGASMKFSQSTADWWAVSNSVDFDFGSGDFTIDYWVYQLSATNAVAHVARDISHTWSPFIIGYGGSQVYMSSNGAAWDIASGQSMGTPSLNTWVHYAIVRQGSTFYTFQNGIQQTTWTSTLSFPTNSNSLSIGAAQNSAFMNGYIDEFRISKGIARWTANFTPPTMPYSIDIGSPPAYGAIVASVVGSGQSYIDLVDPFAILYPCDTYQIEFRNAVSDLEIPPISNPAGALLTAFCSSNSGVSFYTGPNYNNTGDSNFPGENNPLYEPVPFGLGVPQTLRYGMRLSVDTGDSSTYGATGNATIFSSGQNTQYIVSGVKGAVGGTANMIRGVGTLPSSAVGQAWFPGDGTNPFWWAIKYGYAGHFDGVGSSQVNAFRLTMGGAGNTTAKIASGIFRLRRMT